MIRTFPSLENVVVFLTKHKKNWFRTSPAQVLKAMSEVAESSERPQVFAKETGAINNCQKLLPKDNF